MTVYGFPGPPEPSKRPSRTPRSVRGRSPRGVQEEAVTRPAVQAFEAMFAGQLLQPVLGAVPLGGLVSLSQGSGEKLYRDLMVQNHGPTIVARGGLGLADELPQASLASWIRLLEGE